MQIETVRSKGIRARILSITNACGLTNCIIYTISRDRMIKITRRKIGLRNI